MEPSIITLTAFDTAPMDGWPAVPSQHRLRRATRAAAEEQAKPTDPELEATVHNLVAAQLAASANQLMQGGLDRIAAHPNPGEALDMLRDLLHEFDSPTIFAGVVMGYDQDHPGMIAVVQVFALLRDAGWTGLSPHLPLLEDCHLNVYESLNRTGSAGAFVAFPYELRDPDRNTPLPPGEPQHLQGIASWHRARSFTWIPAAAAAGQ